MSYQCFLVSVAWNPFTGSWEHRDGRQAMLVLFRCCSLDWIVVLGLCDCPCLPQPSRLLANAVSTGAFLPLLLPQAYLVLSPSTQYSLPHRSPPPTQPLSGNCLFVYCFCTKNNALFKKRNLCHCPHTELVSEGEPLLPIGALGFVTGGQTSWLWEGGCLGEGRPLCAHG